MPTLELPRRIYKKDRKFHRGMFVAANVLMHEETGEPLFGKVDSDKVEWMQKNRYCQLCGQRIAKKAWCVFPGDIGRYKYQEAPLHIECAAYSIQVCPHIKMKWKNFGVALCKTYDVYDFEAPNWLDPGCVPRWNDLGWSDRFVLQMAHDISCPDGGEAFCRTCPEHCNNNGGRMTAEEFLKWAERMGIE